MSAGIQQQSLDGHNAFEFSEMYSLHEEQQIQARPQLHVLGRSRSCSNKLRGAPR